MTKANLIDQIAQSTERTKKEVEQAMDNYDLASRRSSIVARNPGNVFIGLAAPSEGRTTFYTRGDSAVKTWCSRKFHVRTGCATSTIRKKPTLRDELA